MFKNLFSKEGWRSTVTVIIQVVLVVLTMFGVFTADEKNATLDAWGRLADAIQTGSFPAIAFGAVSLVQQVLLAINSDPKKPKEPKAVKPAK